MENYMIAVVFLLVTFFISRTFNEKANKKLDETKKAELVDLFSKDRIYSFGIIIIIIVLFFLSIKYEWIQPVLTYIIYIVVILGFMIVTNFLAYKKLKSREFPDSYIKSYLLTSSIRIIGIVVFFVLLEF